MTLSEFMSEHRLSPEEMAAMVGGVSNSGIKKWMYGERMPRRSQMRRIAEVTGDKVLPNDFIFGPSPKQESASA